MLLLLLGCLLPATEARERTCLRCWPALPALMDYDLQVLWGAPEPPKELSRNQDHLEKETARLFDHIDKAIKNFRVDTTSLLEEINIWKQLFSTSLSKISEELKDKDLHSNLEVINCVNCRTHLLTCEDLTLCPGRTQQTFLWAVSLGITLPLAVIAGDLTFSGTERR
uniref:Testis expressed 51 n=1 Tax=Molossus molossus TaxID=27622 RepID=A0A7J8FU27_MOLMO|nr:testis expressed 51 [Molossus molossus]